MLIGVISDTHGRLDPSVEELFAGVERIVHAGDVGDEAILARLGAIAPLTAVRGNCDDAPWGLALPCVASEVLEGVRVAVVHDRVMLDVYASPGLREAMSGGVGVLIHGHTHCAEVNREQDTLCLNPGSASLPHYELPRSVALLRIDDGECSVEIRGLGHDLLL
jgi:putative phosphoesterase